MQATLYGSRTAGLTLITVFCISIQLNAAVISVPADQPTIQAGIDVAVNGDEVVVAPGTYEEIIDLSGKAITVRSSGGAELTIIDATNVSTPPGGKPVVRIDSGEGPDTVIEGFTLTGGTGDEVHFGGEFGGGIIIYQSSPTVVDCVMLGNVTGGPGGGVGVIEGDPTFTGCVFEGNTATGNAAGGAVGIDSNLIFRDCIFRENSAAGDGGAFALAGGSASFTGGAFVDNVSTFSGGGGAVYLLDADEYSFSGVLFEGNAASLDGGAIKINGNAPVTIDGCTFLSNNSTDSDGGAIFDGGSVLQVTNSVFIGNSGGGNSPIGGAIFVSDGSLIAGNCMFTGNSASEGGVISVAGDSAAAVVNCSLFGNSSSGGGALDVRPGSAFTIASVIAWGNTNDNGTGADAQIQGDATVTYSIVQGGFAGTGNLEADPLFVDPDGPDDIIGTEDDNLRLTSGSPAIDSGDSPTAAMYLTEDVDLDGNPRVVDDPNVADTGVAGFGVTIDRGSYEFQVGAVATGACCLPLGDCVALMEADCTAAGGNYAGDGVDCASADCPAVCLGDMNGDGALDGLDTQLFVAALLAGAVCP